MTPTPARRRISSRTSTLGALALVAACSPDAPVAPNRTEREPARGARSQLRAPGLWRTLDERYAELADSVPGFGGLFYDAAGRLTVYAKTPAAFDAPRLVRLLQVQRGGRSLPGGDNVRVLAARYDFRELLTLYRNVVIPAIPTIDGVTTSDIDEMRHRIVIGVRDEALVGKARQRIAMLGLPADLTEVEVVQPARIDALLTNYLRPVPGGMRIFLNPYVQPTQCTVGYNLIRYVGTPDDTAATDRYFVTNSHCTITRNVTDSVLVNQGGSPIGREIGDPAAFDHSYTAACPVGYACRFADAALFKYDSAAHADQGRVAFPTLNTLSFTTYVNVTAVVGPTTGYTVNMIGAQSGRRVGTVLGTCVDVWGITDWPGGRFLCQGKANYTSVNGDSGGPVITAFGDGTAWATGINWGHNATNAWFSSMDAVLNEFFMRLPGFPYLSPVMYP